MVTPGYPHASLDAKTGVPDPRFGRNGVVDLMEVSDFAGPAGGGRHWFSHRQRRRSTAPGPPGETWNSVTKTGADGTVGIDPAVGQISSPAPPSSSTT